MTDLEKARQIINHTDRQMAELFEQRMDAAKLVSDYKKKHALPVDDLSREEEMIKRNTSYIQNEDYRDYYVDFLRCNIELSKKLQHRLLDGMRVAYSGVEGAFANIASERIFPSASSVAHSDFKAAYDAVVKGECDCAVLPIDRNQKSGTEITVTLKGLKGGHSGVEIDKKRINANTLAGRFLNYMKNRCDFDIISINGGDKANAIPNYCQIKLCSNCADEFKTEAYEYINVIKSEISAREPDFDAQITLGSQDNFSVLSNKNDIIGVLIGTPNGIIEMSAEIENLVETSLNLGILATKENEITLQFALRSNKQSALDFLEEKLQTFFEKYPCKTDIGGKYPTWEFKENSNLQKLYCEVYSEQTGNQPKVEAIHAGLECAVFSSKIKDLDCIAIGPTIFDAHTTNEKLSISSTKKIFNILTDVLTKLA